MDSLICGHIDVGSKPTICDHLLALRNGGDDCQRHDDEAQEIATRTT
jgi:hypothetical protein